MRGVKKENLPSKVCVVCNRPFTWRKKWERCWDEVTTCSKSCNSKRKGRKSGSTTDAVQEDNINDDSVTTSSLGRASMATANVFNLSIDEEIAVNDDNETDLEVLFADASFSETNLDNEISEDEVNNDPFIYPCLDSKARRKADKKKMKSERRAQREGRGDPSAGQKQCTICNKSVNLLIRCTYDRTEEWGMVCGKCWKDVSGGVVDGDAAHPFYRYGGLWKNRRAQKS
jgi:hypothetical protein